MERAVKTASSYTFDIIIVGGGHAGYEAALAFARLGGRRGQNDRSGAGAR